MSTRRKELERLIEDHPEVLTLEVLTLTHAEMFSRYWMYFPDLVARARASAHMRKIRDIVFTPILTRLDKVIDRILRSQS